MLSNFPTTFKFSIVVALFTLIAAFNIREHGSDEAKLVGYFLLGLWVLVPPIWFLYEYQQNFPKHHDKSQREVERLKHLHELSRNIWLAFVLVLTALMQINMASFCKCVDAG